MDQFSRAFSESDNWSIVAVDDLNSLLQVRLLRDLFTLAHVDQYLTDLEQDFIDEYVARFGTRGNKVRRLKKEGRLRAEKLIAKAVERFG